MGRATRLILSIGVLVSGFIMFPVWRDAQHLSTRLDQAIILSARGQKECAEVTSMEEEGYTVWRNFLNDSLVQELRDLYYSSQDTGQYAVYESMRSLPSHLIPSQVKHQIERALGASAHILISAAFIKMSNWSSAFAFHIDHDPYFFCADTKNEYNLYFMLEKQDKSSANLGVMPVNWIRQFAPGLQSLSEGKGALRFAEVRDSSRCLTSGNSTYPYMLLDDNTGRIHPISFRMEDLECTPHLEPGDVLLLRGDALHRTQPQCNERLSVTIRLWPSDHKLNVSNMLDGALFRYERFRMSRMIYADTLAKVRTLQNVTVATLIDLAPSSVWQLPCSYVAFFVYYAVYIELRYWFGILADTFNGMRGTYKEIECLHGVRCEDVAHVGLRKL